MSKGDLYIRCDFFEQPWIKSLKTEPIDEEAFITVFYIHMVAADCHALGQMKKMYANEANTPVPFDDLLTSLEQFGLVKTDGERLILCDNPYIYLDKGSDSNGRNAVV